MAAADPRASRELSTRRATRHDRAATAHVGDSGAFAERVCGGLGGGRRGVDSRHLGLGDRELERRPRLVSADVEVEVVDTDDRVLEVLLLLFTLTDHHTPLLTTLGPSRPASGLL